MSNTSPSPLTPERFGEALLDRLRAEYSTMAARAEQASIEAERLAKDAEKLAGALEAAERIVSQMLDESALATEGASEEPPQSASLADVTEIDRPTSGFVAVPRDGSLSLVRDENWAKRLRGMTQKEALVAIAQIEGGTLDVKKARDILIESGLTKSKNPRTVYGVVHTILRGSDQFEKGEAGEFRLISPANRAAASSVATQGWRFNPNSNG